MTQWEVYGWNCDWPVFNVLYSRFHEVTFILTHDGLASAGQVQTVLLLHPNVLITLSKKEISHHSLSYEEKEEMLGSANVDNCKKLIPELSALIDKYPDCFIFATDTDRDFRWAKCAHIVKQWRLIFGRLHDGVAQAFAWRNTLCVYVVPL